MLAKHLNVKSRLLKLKQRLIKILSAELSINKVSLAFALGIVYGLIPFFLGVSVYLSMITAWRLRLNHVLIQLISNAFYPIQILLFVPFLRAGTALFSSRAIEFSTSYITGIFRDDITAGLKMFGEWIVYGILLWALIAVVLFPVLYYLSKSLLRKYDLVPKAVR